MQMQKLPSKIKNKIEHTLQFLYLQAQNLRYQCNKCSLSMWLLWAQTTWSVPITTKVSLLDFNDNIKHFLKGYVKTL